MHFDTYGAATKGNEPTEYRMTSLIFGATSSPATSIYIKILTPKNRETEPEVYRAVIKPLRRRLYTELRNRTKAIDIAQRTEKSIDLHTENSSERVLGLNWNSDRDELTFNLNLARLPHDIMNSERPTKRQVLKIVMSLFDPLGLASPVTTKAKQLLQEIWRRGTGWDDEIDQDLATQWNDWKSQLINLKMKNTALLSKIYRRHHITATHICGCQRDGLRSSPLLASDRFSRSRFDITDNSQIESGAAQNHVDTETRTQAAVMGTRMATTVIEEHDRKPNTKFYWTDSKTVLTWLKNGARSYKPFVAHRIAAIEENSTLNEWRWVPTKQNVADDATRNVPRNLDRWYNGPEFLQHESNDWPTENLSF
ncbi:hypothetical protein EVAR_50312_1 [Eumeta japonica]|uniref:Uncharacterized protein n=1 Tax=Eumeta variegata TaxID=151549 RepID=A0A4C1ZZJ5_EUMVA|nr:hypothetical protein EVAR_50312_1 [Eumeta japonica]